MRAAMLLAALGLGAPDDVKKPNVVFIMADDLGREGLSCYGSTSYSTPHLDALARGGMRFAKAFSTPLCSPTRVMLMTGRYGFRTGWTRLIEGEEHFDFAKEKTFGHVLRQAGYATGLAGKWQLAQFQKHPHHVRDSGFDESCCWTWAYNGKRTDRYWNPSIWKDGKLMPGTEGKYGPDLLCDFVVDFIRRHKDGPFFLYYPMVLVHNPFEATPDSADRKAKGNKTLPDMIAYMDKIVGRVVGTLDELKIRDKTLVVFTGDNGTTRGIPSKMGDVTLTGGKGGMLDAGSHVPFIASWPGTVPAGRVVENLVDLSDVMPTLCELAGTKPPAGVTIDGRSIVPVLRGQGGSGREWVFSQLGNNRFVREARWKLHSSGKLYDLQADPFETKPAEDGPEAAAARKRLEEVLSRLK